MPVPAAVAFRYLCDPRNRPEWQSSLRSVEVPPEAFIAALTSDGAGAQTTKK